MGSFDGSVEGKFDGRTEGNTVDEGDVVGDGVCRSRGRGIFWRGRRVGRGVGPRALTDADGAVVLAPGAERPGADAGGNVGGVG